MSSLINAAAIISAAACVACSDAAAPRHPQPREGIRVLSLMTFDGSGQAVHPDPALTPLTWDGAESQLFATPYPNGDASKENPSLYARSSLFDWRVPSGVMNPVVSPASGYLSDPDELYNPEAGELWLYYRAVGNANQIYVMQGAAPDRWSSPTLVVSGPNHSVVSPTIVRRGPGDWMMWSVNSGPVGCSSASTTVEVRRSSDGINWSSPLTTDLMEDGVFPWHIDVEWIPSKQEFWSLYNVKLPGSCTTASLHFARSTDGLHWTVLPGAVLDRGQIPEFADIVYRSSFIYDDASRVITIWYSGARFDDNRYTWKIAVERLSESDFFDLLSQAAQGLPAAPPSSPPLTNETAP